jgi:hypothetical protein
LDDSLVNAVNYGIKNNMPPGTPLVGTTLLRSEKPQAMEHEKNSTFDNRKKTDSNSLKHAGQQFLNYPLDPAKYHLKKIG